MRSKPYAKNLRKTLKYKLLLDFLHGFSSHISTTRRVFQKIAQKAFFEVHACLCLGTNFLNRKGHQYGKEGLLL